MTRDALVLAAVVVLVASPLAAQPTAPALQKPAPIATADLMDIAGKRVGVATFWQGPKALVFRLSAQGLPPGVKGMHLHAVGKCDGADGFKSAAGHVKHSGDAQHGLLSAQGPETGDLPNLIVPASGAVDVEVATERARLDGPDNILGPNGASLIIHAQEDDHISQPIGNAGARIACGVIVRR